MGTGKALSFLSRVLALILNVGLRKINLAVVCRIDEGKSLEDRVLSGSRESFGLDFARN